MISSRTKKQLVVFVIITLLGVTYVGARYAKLGRLFYNDSYAVTAHFRDSGGIFTGAEVDYRGVQVGEVSDMKVTPDGVDVVLSVQNSDKDIPADTLAVVANRSAVGEQFVDLEPQADRAPYLKDGSQIATDQTQTPVSTTALLTNLDALVNSVPKQDLRTVVTQLGTAFHGTGPALSQIIDTSTSFIKAANQNFGTTTALIRDAKTVLGTQEAKEGAIRAFARDLDLFTTTLAGHDRDLRNVIDHGSATVDELRSFLQQNQVDLGRLIANLVTTGKIVRRYLPGIRQTLILYPYVVAGGFTVVAPSAGGHGNWDAHFGLILQQDPPPCERGYDQTGPQARTPYQRANKPMDTSVHCAEPSTQSDPRAAKHAPAGSAYRAPVASYDVKTGKLSWTGSGHGGTQVIDGQGSGQVFGKDAGQWLLLQPALAAQE